MSTLTCRHCGCSEIDTDPARGDSVCTNCGTVLEDNIIVSEVQFEENACGGTSAIGQFVSADGKSLPIGGSYRYKSSRDSRSQTLAKARKSIESMAQQLRLNQHCVDVACRFFEMAVVRRFTSGRSSDDVIAACLYLVCRTERKPVLLLDFSEILRKNVYTIGHAYLRLAERLSIKIPCLDPTLYVIRFAHRLGLGNKTHAVSEMALRLVKRMKCDWLDVGRRPSGLCGAALIVAARNHDISVTIKDIINVVKVCEATVKKRLTEFGETPSGKLTVDEFMAIDLEEQQDPPAFKNRLKKAKLLAQKEDDPAVLVKITKFQREIESALEKQRRPLRGKYAALATSDLRDENEDEEVAEMVQIETIDSINEFLHGKDIISEDESVDVDTLEAARKSTSILQGLRPTPESLGLTGSIEDCMKITDERPVEEESGELDLTGIDDDEIDCYIMNEAEVKSKTNAWTQLNADYLKELKEKEEREAKEREENVGKPEKKKRKIKQPQDPYRTCREATEKMLQEKRISNKINYEVLFNVTNKDDQLDSPAVTKPKSPFVTPTSQNTPLADRMASVIFKSPQNTVTESRTQRLPSLGINRRPLKRPRVCLDENKNKPTVDANPEKPAIGVQSEASTDNTSDLIVETEPVEYAIEEHEEILDKEDDEDDDDDDAHSTTADLFFRPVDAFDYEYGYDCDDS